MSEKKGWTNPADFSIDDILEEAREIKNKYGTQAGYESAQKTRTPLDEVDRILAEVRSKEPAAPPRVEEKTRERQIRSVQREKEAPLEGRPVDYCFGVPDHTEALPELRQDGQVPAPSGNAQDDTPRFPRRKQEATSGSNIRKRRQEEEGHAAQDGGTGSSSGANASPSRHARTHYIKSAPTAEVFAPEPPEMIEKPAILRKESKFEKTADLQAVPTIVPVDGSMTRSVPAQKAGQVLPVQEPSGTAVRREDVVEGQIKLLGFDEDESPASQVDESQVERELQQARSEKVKQFRLFKQEEPSNEEAGEEDYEPVEFTDIEDYTSPGDAPAVLLELQDKRRKLSLRTAGLGLALVIALVLSAVHTFHAALIDKFFGEPVVYIGVTIVLLALAMAAALPALLAGWKGIFTGRVDSHSALSFAGAAVLCHTGVLVFFPNQLEQGNGIFSVLFLFALFTAYCGKCVKVQRMLKNFRFCSGGGATHAVCQITREQDALEIGRNLVVGQPEIQYSGRMRFPKNFLRIAHQEEPADSLAQRTVYIAIGASFLLGAIAFALKQDWLSALTVFTASSCITVPVSSLLTSNLPLLRAADDLAPMEAMVNGYEGVYYCTRAGAVVMEAAELFPQGSCCLHGIKTFGGMRVDEAILYTAAVVIGANGPLGDVFNKVIEGKREILPDAQDIVYEDRMGNSAWIYSRKVLVGNRELLIQHGISVPDKEFEYKYRHDGRQLLYLAIAGKVSAMFVVSYQVDEGVRARLDRLERTGLTVLIRTSDPNIEEEELTRRFGLPEGFLRVISSHAGRIYDSYEPEVPKTEEAYALTHGKASSLLEVMDAVFHLKNCVHTASLMQLIGIGLGFALTALLGLTGGPGFIKPLQLLLYQAVWAAVALLTARYRKLT